VQFYEMFECNRGSNLICLDWTEIRNKWMSTRWISMFKWTMYFQRICSWKIEYEWMCWLTNSIRTFEEQAFQLHEIDNPFEFDGFLFFKFAYIVYSIFVW